MVSFLPCWKFPFTMPPFPAFFCTPVAWPPRIEYNPWFLHHELDQPLVHLCLFKLVPYLCLLPLFITWAPDTTSFSFCSCAPKIYRLDQPVLPYVHIEITGLVTESAKHYHILGCIIRSGTFLVWNARTTGRFLVCSWQQGQAAAHSVSFHAVQFCSDINN